MMELKTNTKRSKTGVVVSNKMQNTVVVLVHSYKSHPKYKKKYKVSKKFYAHTEAVIEEGSTVVIQETRPISKLKKWLVVDTNK